MSQSIDRDRADFDQIAAALELAGCRDELSPSERPALQLVPSTARDVLEIGCGHGVVTRALAAGARRVTAIDLSPEMIRLARSASRQFRNIEFIVGDFLAADFGQSRFDAVVSFAAFHHMPLVETLNRCRELLRSGGTLLVQDIEERRGLRFLPWNALAYVARKVRATGGRSRRVRAVERLYRQHGAREQYLSPAETEHVYTSALPGCRIIHHLEWRYSVIWRRP